MKRYAFLIYSVPTTVNSNPMYRPHYSVEGISGHTLNDNNYNPYNLATTPEAAINACSRYMVNKYAYKTLSGALKGAKMQDEWCNDKTTAGYWTCTYKLITLDI